MKKDALEEELDLNFDTTVPARAPKGWHWDFQPFNKPSQFAEGSVGSLVLVPDDWKGPLWRGRADNLVFGTSLKTVNDISEASMLILERWATSDFRELEFFDKIAAIKKALKAAEETTEEKE